MITITINGVKINADENDTILTAAKANGIYIPTLCAYEGMSPKAACGLCAVTIEGVEKEKLACATRVKDGMNITTDSDRLFSMRKSLVQDMFRQHTVDCHHCLRIGSSKASDFDPKFCENCFFCDCVRDGFCELQRKALEFGVDELPFEIHEYDFPVDDSAGCIIQNPNKCIKCRRCIDVCKAQDVDILKMVRQENGAFVGAENSLFADGCIKCGRCVDVCPTGALFMKEAIDEEIYFAHSYNTETVALLDDSVIPELEKLFGAPEGSFTSEQIADGLRKIGIDHIYGSDEFKCTDADITPLLAEKISSGKRAILACDFAAKRYLEKNHSSLSGSFIFIDSSAARFSDEMKKLHPGARLYHISGVNSFGAEAAASDDISYFINARQLYRMFRRTGVNVSKRKGTALDCVGIASDRESSLIPSSQKWKLGGGTEQISVLLSGKELHGLVCLSLRSARDVIENDTEFDFIYVVG